MSAERIRGFYTEYHGHKIDDLERLASSLPRGRGVIYLVGDSTLDNKYWLIDHGMEGACNGYEECLQPARSPPDVAHWINHECVVRGLSGELCCVNAAIEESTLGLRHGGTLLPQDAFVQRHLCEKDVLCVSMGGNDIALRPTLCTIVSMATLLATPSFLIQWGLAPGLGHFVGLFRDATRRYLQCLMRDRKPRCVVACMLYYLDETPGGSWADFTLQKLGYDKDPTKLQLIMREVYRRGTSQLGSIDGVPVVPVPMYEALDGKTSDDYVQRVEPSSQGGRKLAALIMDRLVPALKQAPVRVEGEESRARGGATPATSASAEMPSSVHLVSGVERRW